MRTSKVFFAVGIIGFLGLVLSHEQGQAQPGKKGAIDLNAKVTSTSPNQNAPRVELSAVQRLETTVTALEATVAGLKKEMAAMKKEAGVQKTGLAATTSSLDSLKVALGPPKGYTTMYITKTNFANVENTAMMKFYVRY